MRCAYCALVVLTVLALCACSSGPCDDASSDRMGQAFAQCVRTRQGGDGGLRCGQAAYDTFCRVSTDPEDRQAAGGANSDVRDR